MPEPTTPADPAAPGLPPDTAGELYAEGLQSLRSADEAYAAARTGNAIITHDGMELANAAVIVYGDQMQRGGLGYLLAALVRAQFHQPLIHRTDFADEPDAAGMDRLHVVPDPGGTVGIISDWIGGTPADPDREGGRS